MPVDNEICRPLRQAIGDGLSQLLSDTYVLFLKTHSFHWSLSAPTCSTLGLVVEEQYVELATAVDAIAERIRALGFPALGSYSFYTRLSSGMASTGVSRDSDMIEQLAQGHDTVLRSAQALLPRLSMVNDPITLELVSQRMSRHEDFGRTLRALQYRL